MDVLLCSWLLEWTVFNEQVQITHTQRGTGGKTFGGQGEMNFLYRKYALFSLLEQLQNVRQALEHTTSQELHSQDKCRMLFATTLLLLRAKNGL